MLAKKKKLTIISKNKIHDTDTGSAAVQLAILDERIKELSDHLKKHRNDIHSRRGLLQLVAKRRKHAKYIERKVKK